MNSATKTLESLHCRVAINRQFYVRHWKF